MTTVIGEVTAKGKVTSGGQQLTEVNAHIRFERFTSGSRRSQACVGSITCDRRAMMALFMGKNLILTLDTGERFGMNVAHLEMNFKAGHGSTTNAQTAAANFHPLD